MNPILVVGAGISGCVIADELAKKGKEVLLLEKESSVGGLARTFRYGGFSFDIGPHRFFSHDKNITDFIARVLGGDLVRFRRHSEVYFLGKYYPWPLRPTVMFGLPAGISLKSAFDLLSMVASGRVKESRNFEEYILANYGPSLYNVFFKEYTEKFLGINPALIDPEWAREGMKRTIIDESISSRNILDILKLFFAFNPAQQEFFYPRGGIDSFCRRLAEDFASRGGRLVTGAAVSEIKAKGEKIVEVVLSTGERLFPQEVVWTAPLDVLSGLLSWPCPGLEYLPLLLFNLELKNAPLRLFQWCYYGSRDIVFSRVSMPEMFHPTMVPEGRHSICVEVSDIESVKRLCNLGSLEKRVKDDLLKVGLIRGPDDIDNVHVERAEDAYPVYRLGYAALRQAFIRRLESFLNLRLAGRTGLFWYNNMDDSVRNALETARNIIG